MAEKILLIDGHSIINRAFYGISDLTNAEGLHTNAIYGFLNTLFKVIDEEKPDYMAVAFDVKAPTFRHQMYAAYKGTRKPMPEELHQQVPVLKDLLHAMGIETMEKAGLEADDLLGTAAKRSEKMGMEAVILSGDRDLLQLASDKILIRLPKTKGGVTTIENYHTEDVLAHYQVTPHGIIELKALMGDASDNIPGVPGIGEKTATKIIVEYETIENAYAHVEDIKPNKAKEALKEHYDMAQMSKTLATINIDADYQLDYEKARLGNIYTEEAYQLMRRLEFKNMLSRFEVSTPQNKLEDAFCEIDDFAEADDAFAEFAKKNSVAFAVIAENDEMFGLSTAYMDGEELKVTYFHAEGFLTPQYLCAKLGDALSAGEASDEKIIITGNLKDTLELLGNYMDSKLLSMLTSGKQTWRDANIAAYLLNPLKSSYTADDLASEFLGLTIPTKAELFGKEKLSSAAQTKKKEMLTFAGYECAAAFLSMGKMEEKLKEQGMWKLYTEMEMPLAFTLFDMEQAGITVKADELKVYGENLQVRITELEKTIYELAGEEFNINSPKQLGVILFEKMGMKGGKKTKTGYSTSAEVLEKLAADGENPIINHILEYRQLTKLKSTYADGLATFIGADGKIHTKFQQTVTATGRLSSTDPNLQNIPVRVELGRMIRKVFVPTEGHVLLDADYSQIELRVLAHMSGDEALIAAYNSAADIHAMTASQVFHVPLEEVTPQLRRNAKAVNFGIVYGISSFGLSQDLSISRKEAQEYIERYFETYPKIKLFLDKLVSDAKEKGYVETMFGRRRPMPELQSSNFMQRSFGERVAMNAPIQGTAADIIKIAMNKVNARLKKETKDSKLLLTVHDELLIEANVDELAAVEKILSEEMRGAADLAVELEIDMKTGSNWYEAH